MSRMMMVFMKKQIDFGWWSGGILRSIVLFWIRFISGFFPSIHSVRDHLFKIG